VNGVGRKAIADETEGDDIPFWDDDESLQDGELPF